MILTLFILFYLSIGIIQLAVFLIVFYAAQIIGGSCGISDNFIGISLSPLYACLIKTIMNIQNIVLPNKIIMKRHRYQNQVDFRHINVTHQNSFTTPHKQTRVQYRKYLNQLNDTLQSMITAGRLKRMQLISINNRAMFNKSKVQRSQWINHRYLTKNSQVFHPLTSQLKLDNRSPKANNKNKSGMRISTEFGIRRKKFHKLQNQQMLQRLIDQQINRIKQKKLLKTNINRQQIVADACKQIQNRLMNRPYRHMKHKTQSIKSRPETIQISNKNLMKTRKSHERTVYRNLYQSSIKDLRKKEQISKKQRVQNQKYFIRKIRKINCKSFH